MGKYSADIKTTIRTHKQIIEKAVTDWVKAWNSSLSAGGWVTVNPKDTGVPTDEFVVELCSDPDFTSRFNDNNGNGAPYTQVRFQEKTYSQSDR